MKKGKKGNMFNGAMTTGRMQKINAMAKGNMGIVKELSGKGKGKGKKC